jgi:hypothetical protein
MSQGLIAVFNQQLSAILTSGVHPLFGPQVTSEANIVSQIDFMKQVKIKYPVRQ